MSWKDAVGSRQEVVLATSSPKGTPRAIYVMSLGIVDGKILIGACVMKKSIDNIINTKTVSLAVKYGNEYYRIDGKATLYDSGQYLEKAIAGSSPPLPKQAIMVEVMEVVDLSTGKKLV